MDQLSEAFRLSNGLEHELHIVLVLGHGQDFHGFFQQEIESIQTIRQLHLLQLPLGVFDPGLQPSLMLLDILQGEVMASGYRGSGGAGQEVSFYFSTMGMGADGAHFFKLLFKNSFQFSVFCKKN
jgi:hypothetical protein